MSLDKHIQNISFYVLVDQNHLSFTFQKDETPSNELSKILFRVDATTTGPYQVKYNLLTIVMNFAIKPPSLRKSSTLYTNQQVTEAGCCFLLFNATNFANHNQEIHVNVKRYSEPKIKKQKKIDLLIAKKGNSQPKLQHKIEGQYSNNYLNNKNQLKNIQNTTNFTSLTSKITTQRNSLKNSRVKLSLDKRVKNLENKDQNQKCLNLVHKYHSFNNEISLPQQPTRVQLTNIQYLSEISMIEQQFVSHDSTALNALNFLNYFPYSQSKGYETFTPVRYMIDAIVEKRNDQIKQTPNPLQKLSHKRAKGVNNTSKQRLYL